MADDDDEVDEGIDFDPTYATAGPRRSTFTPPTGNPDAPYGQSEPLDDDALADAIAADLSRVNTGAVPAAPYSPPSVEPSTQYPAPAAPPPPPAAAQEYAPPPETARAPIDEADAPSNPAPTSAAPAPWSSFPAPDPAQAVPLPDPPGPQSRRALPDDQPPSNPDAPIREHSPTLDMIEKLQAELELREREAREQGQSEGATPAPSPWNLDAEPVPDAAPDAQPTPDPGPPSFINPESPVAAWPLPSFDDEPEPGRAANLSPSNADLAAQRAAADTSPTDTSAEEAGAPEQTRAPWNQPAPDWQPPVSSPQAYEPPVAQEPYPAAEAEAPAPPAPQLPAWEVPAPGPNWAPGPEYGIDPEPEPAAEPASNIAPPVDAAPPVDTARPIETAPPVDTAPPIDTAPAADWQPPAAPAPEPTPDTQPPPAPAAEPTPTPASAPDLDDERAPFPAAFSSLVPPPPVIAPEWMSAAEPAEPPAEPAEPPAEPAGPLPEPAVPPAAPLPEPAASLPEPAAPLPDTNWEPQPWDPEPVIEAEIVPDDAEPEPEPAPVEPDPAPADPPPLIEPNPHGPPLLPSQAAGRPPLLLSPEFGAPPSGPPVDLEPPVGVAPAGLGAPADLQPPVGLAPPQGETVASASAPEFDWAAPTGVPLAPPAGDTLDSPTLDAGAVAAEVAASGAQASAFDDLLSADSSADEEPQLYRDPEPSSPADAAPEAIFIEPMPVAAGEAVPTDTGTITVIDQAYEEELPDDVDDTDRVVPVLGAVAVDTAGVAIVTGAVHPPSGPISTVRVPEDEVVLSSGEPVRMRVFSLEESGLDATPVDHRVGRAARLFWLWFASNSSILSLGLGATVFAVGMSLRQSVVSVLAGVALSFIPLGLTTLAGKRSGMPTMVVSRATFGLLGNVIPALLALFTRVFWGAVLLWLLASSVAIVLVGAGLDGGLGDRQLLLISLAIAFLVALLVAFAGYPLFARIQLILSVVSGILVVGLTAMTWKYVDFANALTTPDGPWVLTVSGAVLVFSFVGLVWANSGADLARYQRPGTSGAASMLWATIGTTLPTFLLIAYGALLAASDKGIATGFLGSPLDTLSLMLPSWYPIPLLAATGLSLLSGVILTLYSGGFALQAAGMRVRRQWLIVIVGVLLAAFALLFTFGVTGGMNELFRDVATTIAVPTAAWAGIFAAETMIRNRRFETQSLLVRGGVYADVRWLNLLALIVISVIGFGLTTASITWLSWQGYGFTLLGMPLDSDLAASDLGVIAALVLGLLVPLIAGVPAIRKQEALRPNT